MTTLRSRVNPKSYLQIFCLLLFTGFSPNIFAKTYFFSDFDGTLTEWRPEAKGMWNTTHILHRINFRENILQDPVTGPETLEISQKDFERVVDSLAKGERQPGRIMNVEVTLADGTKTTFNPANYQFRSPEGFRYFLAGKNGEEYLVQDLKAALNRSPEGKWMGKAYPYMAAFLSNPESAKNFGIVTARNQERSEWQSAFALLQALPSDQPGKIINLPDFEMFHGLTGPNYEYLTGNGMYVPGQKVAFYAKIIKMLENKPLEKGETYHYLIVAEDNQATVKDIFELFRSTATARVGTPLKLALFNAGNNSDVRALRHPAFMIFDQDGTVRRATPEERFGELPFLSTEQMQELENKNYKVLNVRSEGRTCSARSIGRRK